MLFIGIITNSSFASDKIIPRKIVVLYENNHEPLKLQLVTTAAEMPLNYLGLQAVYYDVNKPLPDIKDDPSVRGILTWFDSEDSVEKPIPYISWLQTAILNGKKLVMLGNPGFYKDKNTHKEVPEKEINKIFKLLGLEFTERWQATYHSRIIYKDNEMVDYEKPIAGKVFPYYETKRINYQYTAYLKVAPYGNRREASDLIVTGPNGGYVALGYAFFTEFSKQKGQDLKKWIINPFLFFEKAYATENIPKPDVTTLDGLRMYFSHIDGDGWNNVSLVKGYAPSTLSAEVVYEDVLKAYPQMPVTVSAITADIDKEWVGTDQSIGIAKKIFALENVQLATHTYSHPFEWEFFEHYDYKKEIPFLHKYAFGSWQDATKTTTDKYLDFFSSHDDEKEKGHNHKHHNPYDLSDEDYDTPRGFANKKFDLENEIIGSSDLITKLSPKNKKTDIVLWSGNCSPFEEAIKMSREGGMYNMNGGDSRFDEEYDSVSWIAPVGKVVGEELQIYAVNSNENTYTDLWTARYFGFKFLTQTFKNTEEPIRLKPMNLYYHMYSAEKDAALYALLSNIKYIQNQPHIAITSLEYIRTAIGFYSTEFYQENENCWSVKNRGKLNTIRFDHASLKQIDFSNSSGVIGQNYYRGALYVALEPTYTEPLICLDEKNSLVDLFETNEPYVISSTWQISNLNFQDDELTFYANGWGKGKFVFVLPEAGTYEISTSDERSITVTTDSNFLTFYITNDSFKELNFSIIKQEK